MRFEVIDSVEGRIITRYAVNVKIDLQDDGKTMKVFISPQQPEPIPALRKFYTDSAGYVVEPLGEGV